MSEMNRSIWEPAHSLTCPGPRARISGASTIVVSSSLPPVATMSSCHRAVGACMGVSPAQSPHGKPTFPNPLAAPDSMSAS